MTSPTSSSAGHASLRILPVRDDCFLVELAGLEEALALFDALEAEPIAGIREIIPAARTLLISFDPATVNEDELANAVAARAGGERTAMSGTLVEIPVYYDGEDLAEVAGIVGTSVDDVIRMHTESEFVAAFTGFAPGFAYLSGGDPRLAVPRRKSPRTKVPAGAVGLAGEFSGIYPKNSPGGWQLIGRTPIAMFDINRDPPSLLQPGNRVRFRNISDEPTYEIRPAAKVATKVASAARAGDGAAAIEIVSVGLPVLFQDLGRAGEARQGISMSGAADHASLKAANWIVGNLPNTPALEIALGGLSFRVNGSCVMALTGAPAPITITATDGARVLGDYHAPIALDDGDVVALAAPASGMRSYLAIRGGFEVSMIIGSAATDTLAQIGPSPLTARDVVKIGKPQAGSVVSFDLPAFAMPRADETVVLDVSMGPRTDWFTEAAVESFLSQEWSVTAQSSRVGIRLAGDALERQNHAELPSEATVRGALQVPASGQPVLFLADHPLTGGYPVIANVASHHLDLAGQIPVGAKIRFNVIRSFSPRTIPGRNP